TIDNITAPAKISIEFEEGEVAIFHTEHNGNSSHNRPRGEQLLTDSIAQSIGLSAADLSVIEQAIAKTGSIGYNNMNPETRTFYFSRASFSLVSYVVFPEVISDSLLQTYNDSCTYVAYTNEVVFECLGGAIGPQCFGEYFFE
ncbi:MAG: hypothetical protein AAF597_11930, partial [Bacteroidota bacterium]